MEVLLTKTGPSYDVGNIIQGVANGEGHFYAVANLALTGGISSGVEEIVKAIAGAGLAATLGGAMLGAAVLYFGLGALKAYAAEIPEDKISQNAQFSMEYINDLTELTQYSDSAELVQYS